MISINEYVNSIKEKRICVIGIGISNEPLIRLLAFAGCNVTACDSRGIESLGMKALELLNIGVKLKLGPDYLDNLDFDIIFRTPGLMPFNIHPVNEDCIITSEMQLFFDTCPCKIIAVTGSDGKTTTTTIIAELLKKSGFNVHLGGNIGKPLLCETPMMKKEDICVVELSSFQLHSMVCAPDIAVITNISPNHLDKHKDFEDYINAKYNIYVNQKPGASLVLNADDAILSKLPGTSWFSTEKETDGAYLSGTSIYRNGKYLMDSGDIKIPGLHNVYNYLAAFAALSGLVDDATCAEVARNFGGVEHRLESFLVKNGVTFINDSIASSPARTIAGLKAMKTKPIVIVGGYDKQLPFDELGLALHELSKKVIVTGQTAEKIISAIERAGGADYERIDDFDSAALKAAEIAEEGDIVMLSPACASFDSFKNFEQRGEQFKKLIMELK